MHPEFQKISLIPATALPPDANCYCRVPLMHRLAMRRQGRRELGHGKTGASALKIK